MQKYSKPEMRLNKGDTIKCHDQEELSKYFKTLVTERYDVTVDEEQLLITINGRHEEAADDQQREI